MARPAKDFYAYEVEFLALAAGANAVQQLQFDSASDFTWLYSCYTADVGAAAHSESTRDYPLVNILITPTDSSAQFMNSPVPVPNIFGNGENPFVMPVPRIIAARSTLTFAATSYVAAGTTYNLRLTLIGIKTYLG